MPTVTDTDVKAILAPGRDYDLANNPSLAPHIGRATRMVARVVECAAEKDITLTTLEQYDMIGWLAAHYYCCSDQTYASKNTSGGGASFHGQTGKGIESTRYGQVALEGDISGCLKAITMGVSAGGFWAGKTESEALSYEDRN